MERALKDVVDALTELRTPFAPYETDLHRFVAERLEEAGLAYCHEARIGSGCRIDFLVSGVGVEIKKGRPAPAPLLRQLLRYAACEDVHALVVVTPRHVRVPERVAGKPVREIALDRLWGVALP